MRIFFYIIFLFAVANVAAQNNASDFVKKINEYYNVWQKKKLHLIFNQDKFSPGDTVYFKAYFLSEDLSGVEGNQVIEVHLVNSSGNSILQLKFATSNGIGENQFVIPPTLTQGFYVVTAYSSWMLNFDASFFFKKRITIVERNVLSVQKKQEPKAAVEGGRLISGLKNKVVIRAEANSVVQLVDASGVNAGHTLIDSTGLGTINFTPSENNSYFVEKIGEDSKFPLPTVQKEGLTLTVSRGIEGSTKFLVTPTPNLRKEFIAIITSRDKVTYSQSLTISPSGSEFLIPCAGLPEGVSHLSVLDPDGRLFASRDFYSQGVVHANADIKVEKKTFAPREKVKFVVSINDDNGQPVEGEFSVKAIATDLFDLQNQNPLADALFIQSYLKEPQPIDRSDSNWFAKLDDLLILNTEDIPWDKILTNNVTTPAYRFSNFIQMRGDVSLVDASARKLPDNLDILFYLQKSKIRYQTTVDNGHVWLAVPELYGQDELLYLAETFYYVNDQQHGEEIPGIRIDWENTTPKFQAAPPFRQAAEFDPYASFAVKNRLINQSYGFYSAKADPQPKNVVESEMMAADVNINVQEYTLFPTMADLIKEVIPYLQHRKLGHRDRVFVALNEDLALLSTGDPLYIIDGIATKNADFFLSLKPSELLKVSVVISSQKLKRFGLMGKNGMVIVSTKKGDAREPTDPSKIIQGLNRPLDFRSHSYADVPINHSPDFRSTVLWNPSVKTTKDGKTEIEFFTSDNLGGLTVRIDGLTAQGIPFSQVTQLNVVNDSKK